MMISGCLVGVCGGLYGFLAGLGWWVCITYISSGFLGCCCVSVGWVFGLGVWWVFGFCGFLMFVVLGLPVSG